MRTLSKLMLCAVFVSLTLCACQKAPVVAEPETTLPSIGEEEPSEAVTTEAVPETVEETTAFVPDPDVSYRYQLDLPYGKMIDITDGTLLQKNGDEYVFYVQPAAALVVNGDEKMTAEGAERRFSDFMMSNPDLIKDKSYSSGINEDGTAWLMTDDMSCLVIMPSFPHEGEVLVRSDLKDCLTEIDGKQYIDVRKLPDILYIGEEQFDPTRTPEFLLIANDDQITFSFSYPGTASIIGSNIADMKVFVDGERHNLSDVITGEHLIYFYRDSCPDCTRLNDAIMTQLKSSGLPYTLIQVKKDPAEVKEGYVVSSSNFKDLGIKQIPAVVLIKDQKIAGIAEYPKISDDAAEIASMLSE